MFENLNAYKIIMVAINLIVLYLILKKLLFKKVTEFMENRTKSIRDSLENAEKAKVEAAELKLQYKNHLNSATEKGEKIIEEARIKAEKESDRIIADAKKQSESIIAKALEEIEKERLQMLKDIRGQVAGLALAAASKLIEANMDTESNRALVDRFIDEEGAA